MANAKDRKSNFELLRIVAMMAIIGSHYFSHGAGFGPSVASRILFHTRLLTSGNTGVAIFLLITGWFVRDAHFSLGKWLRLVGETWFYSWIGLLIALFVNRSKVDMLNVLTALFPISSAQNWYAGNFIILYLFMPFITKTAVYLNSSIEEYNKLMAFSVFSFVLLGFVTPFNKVVSNFVWMLFCVLWGNYLRLFTEKRSITVKQCLSFLLIIELVITFYSLTVDYLYNTYKLSFIDQMRDHLMGRFSVCTLTAASLIVILFSRLCFFSKTVNTVAGTIFGVYLIHDHPLLHRFIWFQLLKAEFFFDKSYQVVHLLGSVLLVLFAGMLIDVIRQATFEKLWIKAISGWVEKYLSEHFSDFKLI